MCGGRFCVFLFRFIFFLVFDLLYIFCCLGEGMSRFESLSVNFICIDKLI